MILSRDHAYRMLAWKLRQAGIANPDLDARLLVQAASDCDEIGMIRDPGKHLSPAQIALLESFEMRRLQREPVSRILDEKEFWGLKFRISPAVLDPRPDSETLIEVALDLLKDIHSPSILDLGTGTGCLLISLLTTIKGARGIGVDLSEAALEIAVHNAERLGCASDASFRRANWAEGVKGQFDLVISNPPYISEQEITALDVEVREHDPHLALSGGPDGLYAYRAIAAALPSLMHKGSHAVIELGHDQREAVTAIFMRGGLDVVRVAEDMSGIPRALVARLPHKPS